MLTEYLPSAPPRVALRNFVQIGARRLAQAIMRVAKLFWLYSETPRPASQEFPNEDLTEEQLKQCERIFDGAEQRLKALESKADGLLRAVGVLVPVAVAALAYLWTGATLPASGWRLIAYGSMIAGSVCLLGAVLAVLRTSSIVARQAPGIQTIIDIEGRKVHPYSRQRDAYVLLWCAVMNHAASDLRFDFLRAGQMLFATALLFLLVGGLSFGLVSTTRPGRGQPAAVRTDRPLSEAVGQLERTVATQRDRLSALERLTGEQQRLIQEGRQELERLRPGSR